VKQHITLVWFRRDLRIQDNPLFENLVEGTLVVPFFIFDPFFFQWDEVSKGRTTFLYQSLASLKSQLAAINLQLHLFSGDSGEVIESLFKDLSNKYLIELRYNKDVQIGYGLQRDSAIDTLCTQYNIKNIHQYQHYYSSTSNLKDWNTGYYEYVSKPQYQYRSPDTIVIRSQRFSTNLDLIQQTYPGFFDRNNVLFDGGSTSGQEKVMKFFDTGSKGYHWKMSRPHLATIGHSSHIAPHLTFGTMSVRQVYQETTRYIESLKTNPSDYSKHAFSLRSFRERLRWRISFTNKLIKNPSIADTNKYREFDDIYPWPSDLNDQQSEWYQRWKTGTTGFALIDASMRQLLQHGWMNFRMRAMNATFLTVICGIPWQWGAKHYMQHLIDGDIAIDSWQWQMQAGITNPFSKTFRIYNPTKNLIEKDPDLEYIHTFIPELKGVSMNQLLDHQQNDGSMLLGSEIPGYPKPMVNIEHQRTQNGKRISLARANVKKRLLQLTEK
jgi:deoxyribodipyrimidine photo-lyase